jgi:hypothetical protein
VTVKEQCHPHQYETIISKALFDKCQDIRLKNRHHDSQIKLVRLTGLLITHDIDQELYGRSSTSLHLKNDEITVFELLFKRFKHSV